MKAFLAAMLLMGAASPAFAADHVVAQKGRRFHPDEVTIARGDTITFTNNDEFIHQIYVAAENFSFDSSLIFAPSPSPNATPLMLTLPRATCA